MILGQKNFDVIGVILLVVACGLMGFLMCHCGGEFQTELDPSMPDALPNVSPDTGPIFEESAVEAGPESSPPADHNLPLVEAGAQEDSGPSSAVEAGKPEAATTEIPDVSGGTIHPLPDAAPTSDACVTQQRGCGGTLYPDGPRMDGAAQTICTPNAGMFEWAEHFMGYGGGGQPLWASQGIGVIPPVCGCNQTCECLLWYAPEAICHGWSGTPVCWMATSGAMQAVCP